jgi:3-isopropylmalate/(R)-2-methylmalate dehydratase small subunit
MALDKITHISGTAVNVPGSDIDTDRIIPARFMKCVTFDGLGEYLFYDVRKNDDGSNKNHPLNEPRFAGAKILVTGVNFGCGSSREHAPQALYRYGFRAVIAGSFAEIFFGNCATLGIPCVTASDADVAKLNAAIQANPALEVSIDVANLKVNFGPESISVKMPTSAQEALTKGEWDPISELLDSTEQVAHTADGVGYLVGRK